MGGPRACGPRSGARGPFARADCGRAFRVATGPVPFFPPACAGCTARLGFAPVSYPPKSVEYDAPTTASMAYSPDSYVLDFEGDCELTRPGAPVRLPLMSPHTVAGAVVDWSRRAGSLPTEHPAGIPSCIPSAEQPQRGGGAGGEEL